MKSHDEAGSVCLINCTGELQSDQFQKLPCQIHEINHVATIDELWNTLNPHAKEWWNLLEIADKQSIELPDFPGLNDIIMLLEIARIIDEIGDKKHLIFILPLQHMQSGSLKWHKPASG